MQYDSINLEIDNGIALVTLNRPDHLNTLNNSMIKELGGAYRHCDENDDVQVVILTGSGKAFCAGADMSGSGETFDTQEDMGFSSCPLAMQPWEIRKPVIAACNGHAIGVGLSAALQCDLRIFAEEGRYGLVQNRRGVVADNAVEYLLPRLIGFELLVRGIKLTGVEALEWGLAGRVVTHDKVLPEALSIARDMVENCSPLVMAMHKRLWWRGLDASLEELVDLETQSLHYSMGRSDAVEGSMAWFEKRAPKWQSKVGRDWPDFL